jgi:tetratricopeptide (TPR) repeat protein
MLPALFLGLAAMLIGFFTYRVTNPTLIKQIEVRRAIAPEQAAFSGSVTGEHGPDCLDCSEEHATGGGMGHIAAGHPELIPRIIELMSKLSENPADFDTRMELAEAFMQGHDPAGAAQHLLTAVELRPESYMAHYYLGIMLYALNRYDESIQSFEQAVSLEEDPHIMFNLALIYLRHTDREAEGLALLERTAASNDAELQERSKSVLENWSKAAP